MINRVAQSYKLAFLIESIHLHVLLNNRLSLLGCLPQKAYESFLSYNQRQAHFSHIIRDKHIKILLNPHFIINLHCGHGCHKVRRNGYFNMTKIAGVIQIQLCYHIYNQTNMCNYWNILIRKQSHISFSLHQMRFLAARNHNGWLEWHLNFKTNSVADSHNELNHSLSCLPA